MTKKVVFTAIATVLTLMLCACPKGVDLSAVARGAKDASTIGVNFQTAEINTYNSAANAPDPKTGERPIIPDADHQFIEKQMLTLSTVGKRADSCIRSAANADGAATCINGAISDVDQLNSQGALYLKSPQAKTDYQLAMTGIKTGLSIVLTVIQKPAAATTATN